MPLVSIILDYESIYQTCCERHGISAVLRDLFANTTTSNRGQLLDNTANENMLLLSPYHWLVFAEVLEGLL